MSWALFFLIIFILMILIPFIKNYSLNYKRTKMIKSIEKEQDTRVITLIHRQEILSIIGIPFTRYINIEDSEEILRAIRSTDKKKPIDLILHTPGGLVLAAEQIAMAINRHPARVRVLVPHYAMSGGTLIALAADEIIIDENAVLGPVDPQIAGYPAESILQVIESKEMADIDDETLIYSDIARKAVVQLENFLKSILEDKMDDDEINRLIENLCHGKYTHDFPLDLNVLKSLDIEHEIGLPDKAYTLMELYPQPGRNRPSVYYVS